MANYTATPSLGLVEAVKTASKRLTDFSGRSRRSELWWWMPLVFIADQLISGLYHNVWVSAGVSIVIMAAGLSVTVRRLHDVGKSDLWVYVSYALGIVVQLTIASSDVFQRFAQMAYSPHPNQHAMEKFMEKNIDAFATLSGISLVWCIVSLVVIIFCLQDSKPEPNKYGESPKYKA